MVGAAVTNNPMKKWTGYVLAVFVLTLLSDAGFTERVDPRYKLPAACFAYVGDINQPRTWKLPYLLSDGRPDLKRLPAAVEAVTTGYRGKTVSGIPEDRIGDVLVKLGKAAAQAGKMPFQNEKTAAVYYELQRRLELSGRLEEIKHR